MKERIILAGRNKGLVNDFFAHATDKFDMLTSSLRAADLENHVEIVKPSAVVVCINSERYEDITACSSVREKLEQAGTLLILIGPKEECAAFNRVLPYGADYEIVKPYENAQVFDTIEKYILKKKVKTDSALAEELEKKGVMADVLGVDVPKDEKAKKRILVVDDDPLMLRLIKIQLQDQYVIATANSGRTALKFLESKDVDLIILDYEMPEMTGTDVLARLRAKEATASIPVVFLTGLKERQKIVEILQLKPQGYLLKPIEKEKLTDMMHKLLD